jgi:hypothetical protein
MVVTSSKTGEDVIIAGSVSEEEAKELVGVATALHPDRPPTEVTRSDWVSTGPTR